MVLHGKIQGRDMLGRGSLAVLACAAIWAAEATYDVRGSIQPAVRASVGLHGTSRPFSADTLTDARGQFRFRHLEAGTYTLQAFAPGYGEVSRTLEVSKSLAARGGVIQVELEFPPAGGGKARQRRGAAAAFHAAS
jgi:hypothetical protein